MVLGYYDLAYGETNLFPITGGIPSDSGTGTGLYSTANVQSVISALSGSNYCNTDPTNGTQVSNVMSTLINYPKNNGGYTLSGSLTRFSILGSTAVWSLLQSQINAGRPMLLSIPSTANTGLIADHIVPVFGYETVAGVNYYACYTTGAEVETPTWLTFEGLTAGQTGGIYEEIQIIPEPSTFVFLSFGVGFLLFCKRKRFKFY